MNLLYMRRVSILPLLSAYTQAVPLAERIVLSLCLQLPNSSATRVELYSDGWRMDTGAQLRLLRTSYRRHYHYPRLDRLYVVCLT